MTVRQWIDFMSNEKNVVIGLENHNGLKCRLNNYVAVEQAKSIFNGWLEEEVVNAYPFNLVEEGKQYCLLIY